jgi:hypothetical protein
MRLEDDGAPVIRLHVALDDGFLWLGTTEDAVVLAQEAPL